MGAGASSSVISKSLSDAQNNLNNNNNNNVNQVKGNNNNQTNDHLTKTNDIGGTLEKKANFPTMKLPAQNNVAHTNIKYALVFCMD